MTDHLLAHLRFMRSVARVPVAPHVAARIGRFADGDEQIMAELAAVLTPQQLSGGSALPDPMPFVASAHDPRLDALRTADQRLLLTVALASEPLVLDIVEASGIDIDVLLVGEARSLLELDANGARITDERIRSQVIHTAAIEDQRALHGALSRAARRRGASGVAAWHAAHAAPFAVSRLARGLLSHTDALLKAGAVDAAFGVASFVQKHCAENTVSQSSARAGIAAFWRGNFFDSRAYLERSLDKGGSGIDDVLRGLLFVQDRLFDEADGQVFTKEETECVFDALAIAARSSSDREAMTQLSNIYAAVYDDDRHADALQAGLFLSFSSTAAARSDISPHAEAHVILSQVAFQTQFGDLAGAARLLRYSVPRLPLVHPSAGIVSSYTRILAGHAPDLGEELAEAFDEIGPRSPLTYDGDGDAAGLLPRSGMLAAAAATMTESASVVASGSEVVLSKRQEEVRELVCRGLTNQEIGAALGLSHRTVEVHVGQILRKHGVRSRARLIAEFTNRSNRSAL